MCFSPFSCLLLIFATFTPRRKANPKNKNEAQTRQKEARATPRPRKKEKQGQPQDQEGSRNKGNLFPKKKGRPSNESETPCRKVNPNPPPPYVWLLFPPLGWYCFPPLPLFVSCCRSPPPSCSRWCCFFPTSLWVALPSTPPFPSLLGSEWGNPN